MNREFRNQLMAAGLLGLCCSFGSSNGLRDFRKSQATRSPNRVLHEAWFAWRVRADTEFALRELQGLVDDTRAGKGWRARAREMLCACRAQDLDQAAAQELPQKTALNLTHSTAEAKNEADPSTSVQVTECEDDQRVLPGALRSDSLIPGSGILPSPPQDLPPMPRMGDSLEQQVQCLDARASAWRSAFPELANRPSSERSSGEIPIPNKGGVIGLFSRWYAGSLGAKPEVAHDLSTMSFEHAVRDDPSRRVTLNDWDLSFGNSQDKLDVCMTGGDHSTIQLLSPLGAGPERTECRAIYGRAYRVHSLDRNTDRTFVFQILEHVAGKWILIVWEEI